MTVSSQYMDAGVQKTETNMTRKLIQVQIDSKLWISAYWFVTNICVTYELFKAVKDTMHSRQQPDTVIHSNLVTSSVWLNWK